MAVEDTRTDETVWERHTGWLVGSLIGLLSLVSAVIAIANPYGNISVSPLKHVITDTNQRFQYPAIVRSGQFDSIVVGTSTSRLLRPGALQAKFGGRFANLAMDSATAWEQYRLAKLFVTRHRNPRTLIVALDHVWCRADAATARITERGFPEWMFDDNPWNDAWSMLNKRTIEISARRLAVAAGFAKERIPFDGYEVFVPPDETYDAAKAREHIHKGGKPRPQTSPGAMPSERLKATWQFPALAWLDEILASPWQRAILVFTPVHIAALPGGTGYWREQACKAHVADIARRHRAPLIDFRIASDITSRDENYWDDLHYRVGIAERIVDGMATAVTTRRDASNGDWKLLNSAF